MKPAASLMSGTAPTLLTLAAMALIAAGLAIKLWPVADPVVLRHDHPELSVDHPHLHGEERPHPHAFVIDVLHARWP